MKLKKCPTEMRITGDRASEKKKYISLGDLSEEEVYLGIWPVRVWLNDKSVWDSEERLDSKSG